MIIEKVTNMNLIIVAGVFTVIGALIEGLISHYGVGIFSRLLNSSKVVINCRGAAEEIGLSSMHLKINGNL